MKYQLLLFILYSSFTFGQEFQNSEFDSLFNSKIHKNEFRIMKDASIMNELILIRIYQETSDNWILEKYFSNGKGYEQIIFNEINESSGEIKQDTLFINNNRKVLHKNLGKEFYKDWLELLTTNILELQKLDEIEYKLGKKEIIFENGIYQIIEEVILGPNDGNYYVIEIKNEDQFNRIEISNPSFYIKSFPEIDEFIYLDRFFKKFENIIKNN
jgi:hypothetical protein